MSDDNEELNISEKKVLDLSSPVDEVVDFSNHDQEHPDDVIANLSSDAYVEEQPSDHIESLEDLAVNTDNMPIEDLLNTEVIMNSVQEEVSTTSSEVECPTKQFSLRLLPISKQEIEKAKAIVENLGISLGDRVWADASPLISKLTEYQIVRLMQDFRRANLVYTHIDTQSPHEETDQNNLNVDSILDEVDHTVISEGAPSVRILEGKDSVLLLTSNDLEGYRVGEVVDLVSAHCSIPRNFFHLEDMEQKIHTEMKTLLRSQKIKIPPTRSDQLIRELQEEIQHKALAKGANAVINIKLQFFIETNHLDKASDQIRIVALGTAAIVDKMEYKHPDEFVTDET